LRLRHCAVATHLRDLIMRNLAVVDGMDLDALRAGIDWRFQSFADYMTMLRGRGAYMNLGVVVGHSAVRTAVMGNDASVRKMPTAAEITENEPARRRSDGSRRDRRRCFVLAKPLGLGRRADALDDQ
jgi:N-acyl-D-aspartate/D-glutamate deacylase